ncbi:MAG TPA: ABC-F family ATP-binding cassette domain-containing protein, partial [Vicinamibacterales bacterium]|nr:ABC-F family ATP-binding cassette domain-containing protein [Vicinamibacterales bacterium]
MIQLSELTKSFGDRVLFDHVTWQIGDRERVGLCGPNGAGKTTLLRMMAGLDEPDSGAILKPPALTVGYLPQDGLSHEGRTVFEEASSAFEELLRIKAEMHALEARLGDPAIPEADHDDMLARYSDLQDRFRLHDGYAIELKTSTVLQGLGFSRTDFERPTQTFSGGWQMRIALAKLLLGQPNLLLLDEPTNHLDLEARNWLETYLNGYPHAVILVSHDRFFLDAVVTRITDLTLRTLTDYVGNYSDYLVEHHARIEALRKAKREQDEEVARVKMFIDRFRYQATKAAQVQSRIKLLEKVVPIEVPPERKRIHFTFPKCTKSGRTVFEIKHARKAYPPPPGSGGQAVTVFRDVNLHIERGDRIALVGPNGAGKSTLMRLLSGEEPPDAGTRTLGHQVVLEYFAQDEAVRLDPALTVYETLAAGSPNDMVPAIRNILGGFLFSGDDVYKKAAVLSGGERTRLAVARMLLRPSNTLLLDEPTNHLDLDSKDVLLEALEDYGGTLIFVSHDRYFVEKLATKIIEIGHGEAVVYPGTYAEFLWSKAQKENPRTETTKSAKDASAKAAKEAKNAKAARTTDQGPRTDHGPRTDQALRTKDQGPTREERKRIEAERKKQQRSLETLQKRIADLEARIADREGRVKELEAAMSAPGFYEDRDASKLIVDQHQALMWEVGDLMGQWEALQEHARPES